MENYIPNKLLGSFLVILSIGFLQTSQAVAMEEPQTITYPEKKTVRILAVDGGGTRGIVPATMLAEIEKETGQSISQLFDIVGGTSIGCVLTTFLTTRQNPDDINSPPAFTANDACNIFYTDGPTIFSKRFIPVPSVYGNGIETVLTRILGDTTYDQTTVPRVGVAFDVKALGAKVFSSADRKEIFAAKDVALSSAAFPLEFNPRFVSASSLNASLIPQYILVDGGLTANDPTALIIEEARKIYPNATKFEVVSLGNGIANITWANSIFKTGFTLSKIVWRLFDAVMNIDAYEPNFYCEKLLGANYTRLNPSISANYTSAVNVNTEYFHGLQQDTHKYLAQNREVFSALIQKLKKPRN